jgi:hypothetical protein
MNKKQRIKTLTEDINNALDAFLYESFIDIPQALGLNINECHEYILLHILNRIKNNHDRYFVEEEDE